MKTADFDYELPERFIAHTPAAQRDHSKMLSYDRAAGASQILHFYDIVNLLRPGDVVVINTTRVIAARLFAGMFEILLLKRTAPDTFECLVKGMKRLKLNETLFFGDSLTGVLASKDAVTGTAKIRFNACGAALDGLIEQYGKTPLPPYINPADSGASAAKRYQTVYADKPGSAAAPTAGLHWTPELMERARAKGVTFCSVLLHVGLGTFRPIKCENIADHKMHAEYYELNRQSADIINRAKSRGGRIVCTGTTSLRVLEGIHAKHGRLTVDAGETDIFIRPPYNFRVVDALITNFHLPKSTLLMLVAAFAGREKTLELYERAKENDFRFFSFGDCMFVF